MQLVSLRNPRAEPRRCSRRPLIASAGPFDVPRRSKWASTSAERRFSVGPRVISSRNVSWDAGGQGGDERGHLSASPAAVSVAAGGDHALVDVPGGHDLVTE